LYTAITDMYDNNGDEMLTWTQV